MALDAGGVPTRRTARVAGVLYLLMGAGTAFGMGYVDPLLRASGDAAETARNLRSSASLFHAGLASTAFGLVAMLFLASALYEIFASVDRGHARLLVVFVVAGVSIALLNMVHLLVAIRLSRGAGDLPAVETPQLQALMTTFLAAYGFGRHLAGIFWGLWLLPFGLLILRSGLLPRVLGILMTIGCFAYLFHSSAWLFFPSWGAIAQRSLLIPTLGEVGTILWLLVRGVREPPSAAGVAWRNDDLHGRLEPTNKHGPLGSPGRPRGECGS
jgi:hypothetical protein